MIDDEFEQLSFWDWRVENGFWDLVRFTIKVFVLVFCTSYIMALTIYEVFSTDKAGVINAFCIEKGYKK